MMYMDQPTPTGSINSHTASEASNLGPVGNFLGRRRADDPSGDGLKVEHQNRSALEYSEWAPDRDDVRMHPGAPQPVADIFKRMVEHRKRVVRQVAGIPAASMRAAIDQGHTILERHDDDLEGPERVSFMAWLERKADRNFATSIIFAMTPWGQKSHERQLAQAGAQDEAEKALIRLHRDLGVDALRMTKDDAKFLDNQDIALLDFMVQRGHIPEIPGLENLYSEERGEGGPVAYMTPGGAGYVKMRGDRKGDYYGSLPGFLDFDPGCGPNSVDDERVKEFANDITSYARQINNGSALPGISDHHRQVYTRWFVLLHEVAHTRFAQIEAPFQPTGKKMSDEEKRAINRWIMGPLAVGSKDAIALLNENHADAIGAMLLLEATGYDPKALDVIQERIQERVLARSSADFSNMERQGMSGLGSKFDCVHAAEWTLKRVIENIDEWSGKTPQQMRQLALSYASDGLMEFIDPNRILANGEKLGCIYSDAIVAPEPCAFSGSSILVSMLVAQAEGIDPLERMRSFDLDPTLVQLLEGSWGKIHLKVKDALAKDLTIDGKFAGSVADGVRCRQWEAEGHFNEILKDPLLPVNNPDHQDYQAMVKAYQRDLPLMRQALGADPGQPSMSEKVLLQWRKARYGESNPFRASHSL